MERKKSETESEIYQGMTVHGTLPRRRVPYVVVVLIRGYIGSWGRYLEGDAAWREIVGREHIMALKMRYYNYLAQMNDALDELRRLLRFAPA